MVAAAVVMVVVEALSVSRSRIETPVSEGVLDHEQPQHRGLSHTTMFSNSTAAAHANNPSTTVAWVKPFAFRPQTSWFAS